MKKLLIGLFTASFTVSSTAAINYDLGEMGSGGGNAIVCFQDGSVATGEDSTNILSEIKKNKNQIPTKFLKWITSIEMYDLYDAKKRRGISSKSPEIINIEPTEKIYSYLDRLSHRFDKSIRPLKYFVEYGKELLPEDNIVWEDTAVKYQNDLGTVSLPGQNCIISTMAAQVNHNDYYMAYIDSRLFNHPKHSKQSKATLILHELVYAVMREKLKHTDSGSTRNIVRYLISSHSSYSEGKISEALSRLGLSSAIEIENLNDIAKKFYWSGIMEQIRLELNNFQYNINMDFEDHYGFYQNEELKREISLLVNKENLTDLSKYSKNFYGELQIIQLGMKTSAYRNEWNNLDKKFMNIYAELYKSIEIQIKSSSIEIIEQIKLNTHITAGDLKLFLGKLKMYFEDYQYFNTVELDYFSYVYERNNESFLVNNIFDHFLVYEQCTATIPSSGSIQIPEDFIGDETCFGTLKLDYIIPNIVK